MSQTCSLVELLLVDLRNIDLLEVREVLKIAGSRGLLRGAVGIERHTSDTPPAQGDLLDFWFVGEAQNWPFERAMTFAGVDAARTFFVSTDETARALAHTVGMHAGEPDVAAFDRMLP